jgi:hypothetical protein
MGFDGYWGERTDDYDHDDSCDEVNMTSYANRTARTFTNLPPYPLGGNWPSEGMHFLQFVGMTGQQMRECLIEMIRLNFDALTASAANDWERELALRRRHDHFSWPSNRDEWLAQHTFYGIYRSTISMCERHLDEIFYGEC